MNAFDEEKIPVPNTVGELIEILEKFPKNTSLNVYRVERYYGDSEIDSYHMSIAYFENIENVNITFH